jgi:hydroxybutyrate-dimer hydrolase
LIDGVAVSEPNVNPKRDRSFTIQQGSGQPLVEHGRPLYDYMTLYTLYEGCAAATPQNTRATQVCTDLKARGLLTDGTPDEAQAKLQQYGLLPEQNALAATYWTSNVYQAVAVAYANAYSKASVTDNLCGFSYAFVDAAGKPSAPLPPSNPALAFAGSNGIPPTIGIQLIRNGVSTTTAGTAPAPMADVDGAICLHNLWAGNNDAHRGRDDRDDRDPAKRLRKGVEDVLATAGLHGKPTVIVHGRSDALIAVNHSSRSYYGSALRKQQNIRYYEVTNAHHLDAFNGLLPGFSSAFIPLHVYFIEGLDRLYAHLKNGKD